MEGSGKRLSQKKYLEGQKILQPFMNYIMCCRQENLSVSAFHIMSTFSKQSSRMPQ